MNASEQAQMKLDLQPLDKKPELWKTIPSTWFDFQDIYLEAVDSAPRGSSLIEVGSFWGQSAVFLAEAAKLAAKDLKVYCVDLFDMRPENNPPLFDPALGGGEQPIHAQFHNSQFETFAHFVDSTRLSPDPLRIMRMASLEAASLFKDKQIHFLFLDGDHEYEYVLRELRTWGLRMAPDGIMAGHDYTSEFHGVIEATTEYFGKDKVEVKGKSWIVRL